MVYQQISPLEVNEIDHVSGGVPLALLAIPAAKAIGKAVGATAVATGAVAGATALGAGAVEAGRQISNAIRN